MAAMAALAVLAAAPARAADDATVQVARLACADGVQVTSRGAPLSQVLLRMSQTLGFELKYWAREDPPVHWDVRRQPMELMAALTGKANLMVRYVPDRRCAGRSRIASVHVLPTHAGPAVAPARPPAAVASRAAAPVTPRSNAPFEYDAANAEYMRAHGISPPPAAAQPGTAATGVRR